MNRKTVEFARVFLFPWIKGEVSVDTRMVTTKTVNTILSIIPAGTNEQSIPLSNISSVTVSTSFNIKLILIGLALGLFGFSTLSSDFLMGLILLLVGVVFFCSGIITRMNIQRSGSNYVLYAACYNKKELVEIKAVIDKALIYTEEKKDLELYFNRK